MATYHLTSPFCNRPLGDPQTAYWYAEACKAMRENDRMKKAVQAFARKIKELKGRKLR